MSEKPRILLADDEPSIVKMVGKRLEVEGFEVIVAMDGEDALNKTRAEKPDLVILDLMLPRLNGYEVCQRLKSDAAYQSIPVILFSAKVQERDEKMGLEVGADAYVRKPFKAPELVAQIKVLLNQRKSPANY